MLPVALDNEGSARADIQISQTKKKAIIMTKMAPQKECKTGSCNAEMWRNDNFFVRAMDTPPENKNDTNMFMGVGPTSRITQGMTSKSAPPAKGSVTPQEMKRTAPKKREALDSYLDHSRVKDWRTSPHLVRKSTSVGYVSS